MATGFQLLGEALGGDSEKSYQEGLHLGARTNEALANARRRVDENEARASLDRALAATGIPGATADASAAALRAGAGLGDVIGILGKQQEQDFRAKAGDPNVPLDVGQRALLGVASGPVEPLYKVGGGYASKFDSTAGITPLGDALGTDGGGRSAQMQLLNALGLVDEAGRITDQELALDAIREMTRATDLGGVPGEVDLNPIRRRRGGLGDAVAPLPDVAPRAARPAPAGTTPASAAPGAATPVAATSTVATNTAEIERAKKIGAGAGAAAIQLPQAEARFKNQTAQTDLVMSNIDKAVGDVNFWTAGPGSTVLGWIPGTPGFDLKARVDTVKANIGFQQLQQMRYESPTGGALGQVAVQELEFLQAALGNLDAAQSPKQLVEMLGQVRQRYEQFKAAAGADLQAARATASLTPASTTAPAAQAGERKSLNGRNYVKINGRWYEDDGAAPSQ